MKSFPFWKPGQFFFWKFFPTNKLPNTSFVLYIRRLQNGLWESPGTKTAHITQGKLHSFTHFPPINSNSSFQLLRPKRWESSLTLFPPHTTFDLAANATGSVFKIYPTLTLSHDLHIYEYRCVPPSPPAWSAYRGLLNWSSWSAPTLSLLQSSLSTAARTILFQHKSDFINSLFHPRSSTISPTTLHLGHCVQGHQAVF